MTIVVALCTVVHNKDIHEKPGSVFDLNTSATEIASLFKIKAIREPTDAELAKYHEAHPEAETVAEVAKVAAAEPKAPETEAEKPAAEEAAKD